MFSLPQQEVFESLNWAFQLRFFFFPFHFRRLKKIFFKNRILFCSSVTYSLFE